MVDNLKKVETFLRDQNDQTEMKKETERRMREARLVSASLLSCFFSASYRLYRYIHNK